MSKWEVEGDARVRYDEMKNKSTIMTRMHTERGILQRKTIHNQDIEREERR